MSRVITLTSPSGATLKTKDKFVDDDIAVQVSGGENITANNIKSGVTILGVSGNMATVIANPTLSGGEPDLTSVEIDGTKYKVGGGGSGGKLYLHKIRIYKESLIDNYNNVIGSNLYLFTTITTSSNEPISLNTFISYFNFGSVGSKNYGGNVNGHCTISNSLKFIFSINANGTLAGINYTDSYQLKFQLIFFDSVDLIEDTVMEV